MNTQVKFKKFLESMKSNDPVLVEAIQKGFDVCFENGTETIEQVIQQAMKKTGIKDINKLIAMAQQQTPDSEDIQEAKAILSKTPQTEAVGLKGKITLAILAGLIAIGGIAGPHNISSFAHNRTIDAIAKIAGGKHFHDKTDINGEKVGYEYSEDGDADFNSPFRDVQNINYNSYN